MAQFLQALSEGNRSVYVRCSAIERVEAEGQDTNEIAPPDRPILIFLRDFIWPISVYGCAVIHILHGIHRDDVFVDMREP